MKTFIVPTDFSHNAGHASAYAVQLAQQMEAEVLLLHAYEAPLTISEYSVSELHFDTMKEVIEQQLEERKLELMQEFGHSAPIRTLACNADLVGNIRRLYASPEAPHLVVIGLTGKGMANFFLGSNTLNIVHHVGQTVLTVPPFTRFRKINKVVFACDMKNVATAVPTDRIKRIVRLLQAELLVLNIRRSNSRQRRLDEEKDKLAQLLEGIPFSFHSLAGNDIIEGIQEFSRNQNADLVAIVPHQYDFWEQLLKPNHTKAIIFKSNIPILTLPAD